MANQEVSEVAIVVGVGPGLGSACVRRFAAEGMAVAAVARSPDKLQALCQESGARAYGCDSGDPAALAALFAAVDKDLGSPTLVVFNVGAGVRGSALDIEPEAIAQAWRAGALGAFVTGQEAARRMVPAGAGTIIYTGATAGMRGGANFAGFAAVKFSLRAIAQSLARELGPRGVHVAHVNIDGGIRPPEGRSHPRMGDQPEDSFLDPQAIADAYVHLHRQPRSAWTQELDLRPWVEKF